ncbi:MAG: CRISPR-associated endonuclease Cas1 [Candidatus Micrarchaeota archaeon]|nr:CRISPR-associated endonuclease Cas1 [Candidatus Micrarchaeota archaeon]
MQLIIDDYGAYIGQRDNLFEIRRKDGTKEEYSADKLEQIIIVKNGCISTKAVLLAARNNIDVVFIGKFGMPEGRLFPAALGGANLIRRKQLEAAQGARGTEIAVKLVWAKMKNEEFFLKALQKSREGDFLLLKAEEISRLALQLRKMLEGGFDAERVFGLEGMAAAHYFAGLAEVMPIKKRDQEGKDEPNALLNYGYGILYGEIERACLLCGLDPYLGFLHADRYGKPSLVLDLIEEFRPVIVDRAIVTLYAQRQVLPSDFEYGGEKVFLSKEGRKKVVEAVMGRLHTEITSDGRRLELCAVIQEQARRIASFAKGEGGFEPFLYRW